MSLPLVSVIIPTMPERVYFFMRALDCYASQDYPALELLTDDGPGVIGEKRNRMCERATGEIIVHFDDDDSSAPGRISDQVALLLSTRKAVAGYHTMLFTDGAKWWRNVNAHPMAFGTSLMYRRDWWAEHRFPNEQLGEDAHFMNVAARAGQLATKDAERLMYATNHAGNTSQRVIGEGWIADAW